MIRTIEQFDKQVAKCTKALNAKLKGTDGKRHIVLCGGTGCLSSHSKEIMEKFQEVLKKHGAEDMATVNLVGCFGFCSQGPFVKIYPEDGEHFTAYVKTGGKGIVYLALQYAAHMEVLEPENIRNEIRVCLKNAEKKYGRGE